MDTTQKLVRIFGMVSLSASMAVLGTGLYGSISEQPQNTIERCADKTTTCKKLTEQRPDDQDKTAYNMLAGLGLLMAGSSLTVVSAMSKPNRPTTPKK